jgi:hypothetical protein
MLGFLLGETAFRSGDHWAQTLERAGFEKTKHAFEQGILNGGPHRQPR